MAKKARKRLRQASRFPEKAVPQAVQKAQKFEAGSQFEAWGGRKAREQFIWNKRFKALMQYRRQHGHLFVPQRERTGLGNWCYEQRRYFKANTLSVERLQKLSTAGFAFDGKVARKAREELQQASDKDEEEQPVKDETVPMEGSKKLSSGIGHMGALVGMRLGKRMCLGQMIAWTPSQHSASPREDQGVDLYKVLFHDNHVCDFNLTELMQGKENLTSDLQTVENVAALRRCVERWYMNQVDIGDGAGESSRSRARKRRREDDAGDRIPKTVQNLTSSAMAPASNSEPIEQLQLSTMPKECSQLIRCLEQAVLPAGPGSRKYEVENTRTRIREELRQAPDEDEDGPWSKRFKEWMQYGRQHGHRAVPQREKRGLGQWCHDQRRAFRAKTLSVERLQKLSEAGFEFADVAARRAREERQQAMQQEEVSMAEGLWSKRLKALIEYGRQHGHLHVPISEETGLGQWCRDQRQAFTTQTLSVERLQKLLEAGFEFDGEKARKARKGLRRASGFPTDAVPRALQKAQKLDEKDSWSKRFKALIEYGRQHGHLHLPVREETGLGNWCHEQRRAFRTNTLSVERLQKLSEAGFEFDGKVARKARDALWRASDKEEKKPYRETTPPPLMEGSQKLLEAGAELVGIKAREAPKQNEIVHTDGTGEVQVFNFASAEDRSAFLRAHGALRLLECPLHVIACACECSLCVLDLLYLKSTSTINQIRLHLKATQ
jgi:hypothetical protein